MPGSSRRAPPERALAGVLAAACLALASATRVSAQSGGPVRASLEWSASEACMTADALVSAVEARLARAVFAPADLAEVRIRGTLVPRPAGGHAATLELVDGAGEVAGRRTLETDAADCHALDESLALVVALLVDVDRRDIRLAVEAPEAVASPPERPSAPSDPVELRAWAGGSLLVGLLPDAIGGGAIGLGLVLLPSLGLDVSAEGLFPATRAEGSVRATAWSWAVGLSLCGLLPRVSIDGDVAALEVDLCAAAHAGGLHVEPAGLSRPARADRALVSVGMLARGGVRVDRFFARIELGARVPLVQDTFTYVRRDGTEASLLAVGDSVLTAALVVGARMAP